jgi:hypothetical protein
LQLRSRPRSAQVDAIKHSCDYSFRSSVACRNRPRRAYRTEPLTCPDICTLRLRPTSLSRFFEEGCLSLWTSSSSMPPFSRSVAFVRGVTDLVDALVSMDFGAFKCPICPLIVHLPRPASTEVSMTASGYFRPMGPNLAKMRLFRQINIGNVNVGSDHNWDYCPSVGLSVRFDIDASHVSDWWRK